MKKNLKTYGPSVLVGFALLALPVLYAVNEGVNLRRPDPHQHVIQNSLTYVLLLVFSYVNHTVFVPRWYLNRRYVRYAVVVFGCTLAVMLVPHRIEQATFLKTPAEPTLAGWTAQLLWKENMGPPNPGHHRHAPPRFGDRRPVRPPDGVRPPGGPGGPNRYSVTLSAKFSIIALLCAVSALVSITVQTGSRLQRIENEKLNAELLQLKAQIHPHFLFNTLNSIYALALRQDDRTAETIVKLSEFMRYMIRDAHYDTVSLEKETAYISNYIDLQRARLRDDVPVHYALTGNVKAKQIAPLLLFSFIENAFKHGVNPDEDSLIRIDLTVTDRQLRLYVSNHKVRTNDLETSNGVGLQNAQERLQRLYPNAHQLLVDDAPTSFTVDLTIKL